MKETGPLWYKTMVFRFMTKMTSSSKYVVFQAIGLLSISLFFPVLFISIAAAKKLLFSGVTEEKLIRFSYLEMLHFDALGDTICFIHEKSIAYQTLMYGQWSVAMFCALLAFICVMKNGHYDKKLVKKG